MFNKKRERILTIVKTSWSDEKGNHSYYDVKLDGRVMKGFDNSGDAEDYFQKALDSNFGVHKIEVLKTAKVEE